MGQDFANPRRGINISASTAIDRNAPCSFSNSGGISFGLSLSTGTAVNTFVMTAGLTPVAYWDSPGERTVALATNATAFWIQRFSLPNPIAFSQIDVVRHITVSNSTQASYTFSYFLYTFSGSTASPIPFATAFAPSPMGLAVTFSSGSTADISAYGGHSGTRIRSASVPSAAVSAGISFMSLTAGEYLFGFGVAQGAGGSQTISLFGRSNISNVGADGGGNYSAYFGDGVFSPPFDTDGFLASMHLSVITQTGSLAMGQPYFRLIGR